MRAHRVTLLFCAAACAGDASTPTHAPPADAISAPVVAASPCTDDAEEDDDAPDKGQRTRWAVEARHTPSELVACPRDPDHIQGEGDFGMKVTVRWDAALGPLDVMLVDVDGRPHVFNRVPPEPGQGIVIEPGIVRIVGGNYRRFVRVENRGDTTIPYTVEMSGVWGE